VLLEVEQIKLAFLKAHCIAKANATQVFEGWARKLIGY